MNCKINKAFTLVELIVVITILAILGTIAFISLQGYSRNARDSKRISDMSMIKSSLELYHIDADKYPDPTETQPITYSGGLAWYQGIFGNSTFINVDKLDKIPTDPLTGKEYAYSVLNTKQEFEIAGILEGDNLVINTNINQTNAAEKTAIALITGTYNGISLRVNSNNTSYILAIPSIITSIDLAVELNRKLETIIPQKELVLENYKNLPSNYVGSNYNSNKETDNPDYKIVNNNDFSKLLVYEGDISNLTPTILITKLQESYTGTIQATTITTNELFNIEVTNLDKLEKIDTFGVNFINNHLGGTAINRIYSTCGGIPHNTTKTFYTSDTVTFTEGTCSIVGQDYICRDGTWKNGEILLNTTTYPYDSCTIDGAKTCDIDTLDPVSTTTINHDDTYTLYSTNNIAWDATENCTDTGIEGSVTCNDGTLEGNIGYDYKTCAKGTPQNCNAEPSYGTFQTYNVPALNHNASYNDQKDISENNGTFRYTLDITCNDGTLSPAETGPTVQTCNLNYSIVGNTCVADTQIFSCATKPDNATWNTVSEYQQTWNGSEWLPSDSTTAHNLAASTTICRYKCNAGSYYNGSTCVLASAGYYVSAAGSSSQTACGGNTKYQGSTGQSSCNTVTAGYYTTGGTATTRTGQAVAGTTYYATGGVRSSCTNKPTYSTYTTSSALTSNSCPYTCNPGYSGTSCTLTYTYSRLIGAYGACSTACGAGTQTRTVACKRSDGVIVSDSYCISKPAVTQACTGVICSCNLTYSNGRYSYNCPSLFPSNLRTTTRIYISGVSVLGSGVTKKFNVGVATCSIQGNFTCINGKIYKDYATYGTTRRCY